MTGVIRMSDREPSRLRVMIDLADDRLTVDAAATLIGPGRRHEQKTLPHATTCARRKRPV
jgi:hypothetical protein